jgi:hypothetical protein
MKITTSYRGNVVEVVSAPSRPHCEAHSVVIETNWQANKKTHMVEIEAGDLLKTAQECCKKLTAISGVEFKVCKYLKGWEIAEL